MNDVFTEEEFQKFSKMCVFGNEINGLSQLDLCKETKDKIAKNKPLEGRLYQYKKNQQIGFIACDELKRTVLFHVSDVQKPFTQTQVQIAFDAHNFLDFLEDADSIGTRLEFQFDSYNKRAHCVNFIEAKKMSDHDIEFCRREWLWLSPTERYLTWSIMRRFKNAITSRTVCSFAVFPLLNVDITYLILKKCDWYKIARVSRSWCSFAQNDYWVSTCSLNKMKYLSNTALKHAKSNTLNDINTSQRHKIYKEVINALYVYAKHIVRHMRQCNTHLFHDGLFFSCFSDTQFRAMQLKIAFTLLSRTLIEDYEVHYLSFPLQLQAMIKQFSSYKLDIKRAAGFVSTKCPNWKKYRKTHIETKIRFNKYYFGDVLMK